MRRTLFVLWGGVLVAIVGAILLFQAPALATHWQMIGENAWGGTTDPARERAFQWLGMSLLAFGLVVASLALHRWTMADAPAPLERRSGPAIR